MDNRVRTISTLREDVFTNFVDGYLSEGGKLHSTSCQLDLDGETVWAAILVLETKHD